MCRAAVRVRDKQVKEQEEKGKEYKKSDVCFENWERGPQNYVPSSDSL